MRKLLIFIFCLFGLGGCASCPYIKPVPSPGIPGVYHRVEKGQTLWRVSKIYNVELDDIVRINRIQDAANIEIGQLIFIPQRQKQVYQAALPSSDDFIWPLKGRLIATFGQACENMINKGVNIQPYSNLNVVASREGKVVFCADNFASYGRTVIIDHGDGFSTVYARNAELFVKSGENIQKGALIAKAGSAGRNKNTYLHFEIRKGHIPQNPLFYLP